MSQSTVAEERSTRPANVGHSNNQFAARVFDKLAQKRGNIVFSPFSIHAALTMCAIGATGETRKQLFDVLNLTDGGDVPAAYRELLTRLRTPQQNNRYQTGDPYRLEVANHLWANATFEPNHGYVSDVQDNFDGGLERLDFAQSVAAAKTINDWAEAKTHGRIKDLVPADALNEDTTLVLTNAVWFKASWSEAFKDGQTKTDQFNNFDGSRTETKLMNTKDDFRYYEDDLAQLVILPYKGGASMVCVLPRDPKSVDQLSIDWFTKATQQAQEEEVVLTLPKFKNETDVKLSDALKALGAELPFTNSADFSGISDVTRTKISEVFHKAFIEVDEKGTEAAAATAVVMMKCSAMMPQERKQPKVFRADRPFLYTINDPTNTILFAGRVEKL